MYYGLNEFWCGISADYLFSNEHINYLISYSFDFRNEELLSYYISFLRFVYLFSLIHSLSGMLFMKNDIFFLIYCTDWRVTMACVVLLEEQ